MKCRLLIAVIPVVALWIPTVQGQQPPARPIVFINGDNGVSGSSSGLALGNVGMAGSSISKHDETTDMARTLLKSCPEVSLTISEANSHPDYLLLLDHHEGSFGASYNQVMVLRPDKSVMFASKKGSVSHAAREGCKAIMADWKEHKPAPRTGDNESAMWNKEKR